MPPVEPIREQIVAAVAARLTGLTAGATYWYTPAEVLRDWVSFDQAKCAPSRPTYCVIEGQEIVDAKMNESNTHIYQVLTVLVVGWVKDQHERRRAVNRAIGDVTVAAASDEHWGLAPTVLWTDRPTVRTDEAALFAQPFAYFELALDVQYVRARKAA